MAGKSFMTCNVASCCLHRSYVSVRQPHSSFIEDVKRPNETSSSLPNAYLTVDDGVRGRVRSAVSGTAGVKVGELRVWVGRVRHDAETRIKAPERDSSLGCFSNSVVGI